MTYQRNETPEPLADDGLSDRDLIEGAAKAAELWDYAENCIDIPWNPLLSDGDAFRLAVKLNINLCTPGMRPAARVDLPEAICYFESDCPRRAIVIAAAEIWRVRQRDAARMEP